MNKTMAISEPLETGDEFTGNYYEILRVGTNATPQDIKLAFRKMAAKYHPDRKPWGSTKKFQLVNRDYTVLSNPKLRKAYDQAGYQDHQEKTTGAMAEEVLTKILVELMEQFTFAKRNYLKEARKELNRLCRETPKHCREYDRDIDKYNYLIDHLEGNALLRKVLVKKRDQALEQKALVEDSLEVFKSALELVNKMKYTGADLPEKPELGGFESIYNLNETGDIPWPKR